MFIEKALCIGLCLVCFEGRTNKSSYWTGKYLPMSAVCFQFEFHSLLRPVELLISQRRAKHTISTNYENFNRVVTVNVIFLSSTM